MRFVLLLLIGLGLWLIVKRFLKGRQDDAPPAVPPKAEKPAVGSMVACARCGVQFPQEEAVRDAEQRTFCSPAHLAAGPQ